MCNTLQSCEFELNGADICQIDGGWTSWSSWGDCIGECGSGGKRMRTRICNNPLPSNNGAPCVGPDYEIEVCEITGCSIDDYEKLAQSDPIRKAEVMVVTAFHEKLPALIELCFSANCIYPIVEKILGDEAVVGVIGQRGHSVLRYVEEDKDFVQEIVIAQCHLMLS
ncbi:hypothetical protein KM043_017305 [Ampulex compressa]|nr:hypothetical protein KM043_017305 [Ampulex compressa]